MEPIKRKFIGGYKYKLKTAINEPCRITTFIYDNGTMIIDKKVLSDMEKIDGWKNVYSRFGKHIHIQHMVFKFHTINQIHFDFINVLKKNKVKLEDILI